MPKATKDGIVEVDGPENPFFVRAGDDYPEGATFREINPPPSSEVEPVPKEEKSGTSSTSRSSS